MKTKKALPIMLSFLAIVSIASTAVLGNIQNAYAGLECSAPDPQNIMIELAPGETFGPIHKTISCQEDITFFSFDDSDCENQGIEITFSNAVIVDFANLEFDETISNAVDAIGEIHCIVRYDIDILEQPDFVLQQIWITTIEPPVVGGQFLPIDSTALMLAGLQSSAIWMLPVLAGAAGVGFAAFKLRRK